MRYFFLLILLLPIRLVAQDSLTIGELKNKWESDSVRIKSDSSSFCFVISRTGTEEPGQNLGIFWKDGSLVILPKNTVPGTIKLENINSGGIILTGFTEVSKKHFSMFSQEVSLNIDPGTLPRSITIILKPPN